MEEYFNKVDMGGTVEILLFISVITNVLALILISLLMSANKEFHNKYYNEK